MAFCTSCGHQLADGAKFCANCGTAANSTSTTQRQTVYDGVLHKCPNCGEIINAFVVECPSCGYELRGAKASHSVYEFALRLEQATNEYQTITLIKNFPIPNTKEDIYEYMIIASANITNELNPEVLVAWKVKVEQSYQKAKLLLKNDPSLPELHILYEETQKKIQRINAGRSAKKIGTAIGNGGKATGRFLRRNAQALPGIIICGAWIASVLIMILLCRGPHYGEYLTILFFDFIAGAILIPPATRTSSSIPKAIVSIGLATSFVIMIPLCKSPRPYDGVYMTLIFFDLIATTIIVLRMFKKPKNKG